MTHDFKLTASDDLLAVFLEPTAVPEDMAAFAQELAKRLQQMRVSPVPSAEDLMARLQYATVADDRLMRTVVVTGVPPIAPQDAQLVWEGDYFSAGHAVDPETGAIDYRRRAAQPEVQKGQRLARLMPAVSGQPGRDIFGRAIRQGRPRRLIIKAGPRVRMKKHDGQNHYYATEAGRVRWDLRAISVDDIFRIGGNVDLGTGNVHHHGAVVINGDVKPGFVVEGDGDVVIHGMVEAATVRCGGSLLVQGGISGGRGEAGTITVGGTLCARFISDAHVQAGGDVVVEKEIINARVETKGEIRCAWGRIVGGEMAALRGVAADTLGSSRGVATRIGCGESPLHKAQIEAREKEAGELTEALKRLLKTINTLRERYERMDEIQRKAFGQILGKEQGMEQQLEQIRNEIELLREEMEHAEPARVEVRRIAHPDCQIRIGKARMFIQEPIYGPIRFVPYQGEIRFHKSAGPTG